ncbi:MULTISPECIES: hypothetical protein [Ramlibacter]|uniref:Uncharacterized protein n=1 Tax=Ramlibacter pinisoli TaxID=2682844 RepID=A0A6N8IVU1_9BURK|nr:MULTISPECIES: hypothetical protein [Ramlibacter]MBA2961130.1 hypothetical protein [Ramlibacter sp. CGMCC 1.13660]MVQ31074.1 hypothetical protein [Ramlibacter pinisoli]
MNRLQAELQRLYVLPDEPPGADAGRVLLVGSDGRVRTLVLQAALPAGWQALSAAWAGVQADLELPPPAIAVTGVDAYQLWLSLAQPVPLADALAFLEGLCARYLGQVRPDRVATFPAADAATQRMPLVPSLQADAGRWSAFVTPDLAALFADEPWVDLPPSADAQANVLGGLGCIRTDAFVRALAQLRSADAATSEPQAHAATRTPAGAGGATITETDPRRFLLAVMNDGTLDLRLRIEAAKALLAAPSGPDTSAGSRPPRG